MLWFIIAACEKSISNSYLLTKNNAMLYHIRSYTEADTCTIHVFKKRKVTCNQILIPVDLYIFVLWFYVCIFLFFEHIKLMLKVYERQTIRSHDLAKQCAAAPALSARFSNFTGGACKLSLFCTCVSSMWRSLYTVLKRETKH